MYVVSNCLRCQTTKRGTTGAHSISLHSFHSSPIILTLFPSMLPTRRTTAWSLLALLVLIATANAGSGIPGQPDTEHSNYGDMGKAKVFAKEHMGDKGKNLSEKEELLMLFSLHDSNKDGYLDGIELRAAFSDYNQGSTDSALPLATMLDMIDHVIAEDDTDNDGKISWEEYLISQKYHEG